MYPVFRLYNELRKARGKPLGLFDTHESRHMCLPWDLDPWMELNNGRTLTLYDLGRVPFAVRTGLIGALRTNGWGMTVAGSSVRYRRRIRMFERFAMRTRVLGWDSRFLYMEQSMWRAGEALNNLLIRTATTDANGIVPPARLAAALGQADRQGPALPGWVQAWVDAEALRPWPPVAGPN